jgi:hypothetical protein
MLNGRRVKGEFELLSEEIFFQVFGKYCLFAVKTTLPKRLNSATQYSARTVSFVMLTHAG